MGTSAVQSWGDLCPDPINIAFEHVLVLCTCMCRAGGGWGQREVSGSRL